MSSPVLAVQNLTVRLPTGATLVHGLDLQVDSGETVAVVGESGCGKSITALSIMGLLPAGIEVCQGQIRFCGRDLIAMPEAEFRDLRGDALSMIFQEPGTSLNPVLTIGEQVQEVIARHQDLTRPLARARAIELLRQVRLPDPERRMRAYPHQLSGGQKQRVMIAAALAGSTRLLIADEPTTALDVTMQAGILRLLKDLQMSHGLALLLITHDFSVVGQMADRVLVMYAGRKVEEGPTQRVLRDPQHPYTQLLLNARPHGDVPRSQRLVEIPGMVSAPTEQHSGCAFAPRCPHVLPVCARQAPALVRAAPLHRAACVLIDEHRAPAEP
jgi:peptide/nickel transport system ATP-binding protein